jgi:hypothetical protein
MNDEIIEWLTNESNYKNETEREMNGALVMLYQLGVVEAQMVNGQPMFTISQINTENPMEDPIVAAMTMYGHNLQAAEA